MRRQSATDLVIERLAELIANDLSPGDKLPAQRELAEGLAVSLPSVRESLATLQAIGVIDVQHGKGTFVSERPALGSLLRTLITVLVKDISLAELFDVRETIEIEIARQAALTATPSDIERLWHFCQLMEDAPTVEDFVNKDVEFHLEIAKIAGNRLWVLILDMVRSMIEAVLMVLPDQKEIANPQHKVITQSIADGDPDRAEKEMIAHLWINRRAVEESEDFGAGDSPIWRRTLERESE